MNFNDYQQKARTTAIYPDCGNNLWYPALGLTGESGEVAEKIKKIYRDSGGVASMEVGHALVKELGDVLWYVANIASELGVDLGFVARLNIEKLEQRSKTGNLHGDGDDR